MGCGDSVPNGEGAAKAAKPGAAEPKAAEPKATEAKVNEAKEAAQSKEAEPAGLVQFDSPESACGTWLRVVQVNDVYKLRNYPPLAEFLRRTRADAEAQKRDCKVVSVLNGDFLSPCIISSLDAGQAMMEACNIVPLDYLCFGNHEFDLGVDVLKQRTKRFKSGKWLNGNISSPEFLGPDGKQLPKWDILEVGDKKVCLTGGTTNNLDIYRPGSDPEIVPITDALLQVWQEAQKENAKLDLLLPMTHQTIAEDRATAVDALQKDATLAGKMPVILGGHEHEVFIETSGETLIVKAGADAENVVMVDIWWNEAGKVQVKSQLIALSDFTPIAECPTLAFVKRKDKTLDAIKGMEIAKLPEPMSTKRVRYEPSLMGSFLLKKIKRGLSSSGVEMVLLQGGAIRSAADYEPGAFSYQNLLKELAFETEMAVIKLPGNILAESISNTRATPDVEAPNFLHVDADCAFAEGDPRALTHINQQPLEPDRLYTVAIYHLLLIGMNKIEPLLTYVKENVTIPDLEVCLPAKNVIMEVVIRDSWRKLFGADELELAFSRLDKNNDGTISFNELSLAIDEINSDNDETNDIPVELIKQMIQSLDKNGDGNLSLDEVKSIVMI